MVELVVVASIICRKSKATINCHRSQPGSCKHVTVSSSHPIMEIHHKECLKPQISEAS
jgi:hypothetical protein